MRDQRRGGPAWETMTGGGSALCVLCVALLGCSDDGLSPADAGADTDMVGTTGAGLSGDSGGSVPPAESSSGANDSGLTDPTVGGSTGDDPGTSATDTADPGGSESTGTGDPEPMPEGVYVRAADGLDSNDGTADAPVRTISRGIALAAEQALGVVYIAEGAYVANSDNNDVVEVVEGISLRGGYSADDWGQRDPAAFVATLTDEGEAAAGFNPGNPHRALLVPAGVTADTVVEGLQLQASGAPNAAAAVVRGDATLRENVLFGGGGPLSTALFLGDSSATVAFNVIDGVDAPKGQPSFGVRANGGAASLHANEIRSGEGMTNRAVVLGPMAAGTLSSNHIVAEAGQGGGGRAVELSEASTAIISNTLVVDGVDTAFHVISAGAVAPTRLDNNNFISLAATAWCYASADGTDVGTAQNNNFGCSNLYNGASVHMSIAALEAALAEASGNVAEPSGVESPLESAQLQDDGSTLCAVARGGLIVAELPEGDIDGTSRTEPWSIGAHELDGACL